MKKIIASIAVALTFSFAASAQEVKVNPWQDCGIGAMIFPDNGVAAAISNVIWDLGTTAVTSASASEDSCNSTRVQTAQFINETYNNLEDELVRGEGVHITAMLNLMSCDAASHAETSATIRSEFADQLLGSADQTTVKAERLFNIAETATANCSAS
ncbi:DUF3015 family protein [Alteromonas sp. ASW11-36]|uniref:DUF3015 family protein n=1 Tax=Alteromonas arenosi TaxID=3055817 RepID=A0ABT7SZZ3_9ALTE|nr:DUF3015 family protein [Alteromonas sp. ASW11-36]MDM7861757.1 DUF3015 family protein [Alteromonas sp. ASW11-36]